MSTDNERGKHGGARPGSGRRPIDEEAKTYSFWLGKRQSDKIRRLAERWGYNDSETVRRIINEYFED